MILKKRRKPKVGDGEAPPSRAGIEANKIEYYAGRESGKANIDFIHLNQISMDETNPRTKGVDAEVLLSVTRDFLIIDPKHKDYDQGLIDDFDEEMSEAIKLVCSSPTCQDSSSEKLTALFEKLIPLRNNVRLLGVLQPIEVVRSGRNKYTVRYGHRRFLASIIAGEKAIFARVVSEGKDGAKITQMSENAHQEKLSLKSRLDALKQTMEEQGLSVEGEKAIVVSRALGLERTAVRFSLAILRSSSPLLIDAIESGLVNSLKPAAVLAGLDDKQLKSAIEELKKGRGLSFLNDKDLGVIEKKVSTTETVKRGVKRRFIVTPKIENPRVISEIMSRLDIDLSDVDVNDVSAVHDRWLEFIDSLVKSECQKEE